MAFQPNRKFKRDYDRLFKKDPMGANMFLLICEIADDKGQVATNERDKELATIQGLRESEFDESGRRLPN